MQSPWRIFFVEDEPDVAETVRELIAPAALNEAGAPPDIEIEGSFDKALETLAERDLDLLVLDVRNQDITEQGWLNGDADAGKKVYHDVRSRRFVPIVFYTALPHEVASLAKPPFVQVVSKISDDPVAELRKAVAAAFDSGFPRLRRVLKRRVEALTKDFMIEFVEKNWPELQDHKSDVAYLLMRRLGISLAGGGAELAAELGYSGEEGSDQMVHPTRLYVALPSGDYRMGDLLRGPDARQRDGEEDDTHWYVILTPSCDLVTDRKKADHVVLAECLPIETFEHYRKWIEAQRSNGASSTKRKKLERLLTSRPNGQPEDRYHYLPAAFEVPDLLVDNQRIVHIAFEHLELYERVASIDSPYSEELSHRFHRYMGRLGTPDLDMQTALSRMEAYS